MASTTAGATLTEGHRIAQARLGAQTVQLLRAAWPLLDPADLDGTIGRWLRVAVPVVTRQRRRSAVLAGQYVQAFRAVELGVDGDYRATLDSQTDVRPAVTSLTVTGPVSIKEQVRRFVPLARAVTAAESGHAAAGMRHALNGGRSTILESVRADRRAQGWARVTSGDPCAFCQILASRGPVYRDEATASFEAHDHCACTAEPVYRSDAAWPPGAREYRDRWNEVTKGLSGQDAINAYRRVVSSAA